MINYILVLYCLSFVFYYAFIWKKSIKRNKDITENNRLFLNKWGNICLVYNSIFSVVIFLLCFIKNSLVVSIFLVFLGSYYLFLMTWNSIKMQKRKFYVYSFVVIGLFLLVSGIIVGCISFAD